MIIHLKSRAVRTWSVAWILFAAVILAAKAPAAEPYTFGVVPQYNQRQLFEIWQPIVSALQNQTGLSFRLYHVGVVPLSVKSHDFVYLRAVKALAALGGGRDLLAKIPMHQPVSAAMADYVPMLDWGLESFRVEE